MTDTSTLILHTLVCEDGAGNRVKAQYIATLDGPRYVLDPPIENESPQLETRWHPELLIDYALRNELRPLGAVVEGDTQPVSYTSGEWTGAVSELFPSGDTYDIHDPDGEAIARVWSKDNVPVIAAAPDLHRALYALRYGRLPESDVAMLPSDIHALVDAALRKVGDA